MNTRLSKYCADFLRESFDVSTDNQLKASHAHELVAAFFGYKSHAALLADKKYPLDRLNEASLIIPDVALLEKRKKKLKGLSEILPTAEELSSRLSSFMLAEKYFNSDIWTYKELGSYITQELIFENDDVIQNELSGVMAETNAIFDEPYYTIFKVSDNEKGLMAIVGGSYLGTNIEGKPFCGDQIDMEVFITPHLIASRRGFHGFKISAKGCVNDIKVESGPQYGKRPKDQFIEETGGFRIGETQDEFKKRQRYIQCIRKRIAADNGSVQDVELLSRLLGTDEDDY